MVSRKETLTTVCIGNPGVGKSTLLNALLGKASFKSGIALGRGLTTVCQTEIDSKGNKFIDTPGLSDIKLRKQAADEIKKALSQGGLFKILFMITLEEGRIRPDDKTTIKLVLDAAPIGSKYSIIINKLYPNILELLGDDIQRAEFCTLLFEGLNPSDAVHMQKFDEKIQGVSNTQIRLDSELRDFVEDAPTLIIDANQVKGIRVDMFEVMKEELSFQIEELKRDKAIMEVKFGQLLEQFEEMSKKSKRRSGVVGKLLDWLGV